MRMLEIDDLSGGYGSGMVLHHVSLSVSRGEIVCVLGPNGAGKTSLIRAITRTLPVCTGRVEALGRDVTRMAAHRVARLGVSVVPAGKGLFPRMSVRENLRIGALQVRDRGEIDARLGEVFELFPQLASRSGQIAGTMSGGEQMMVAIGRSLMAQPDLLLLDEPSHGLAPALIDEVFDVLAQIAAGDRTVVLVEQQVHRSLALASRGYVLQKGAIVARGSAHELQRSDSFVRAYL